MTRFLVKLLTPSAKPPERQTPGSAGADVRADFYDTDGKLRSIRCEGNAGRRDIMARASGEYPNGPGILLRPGMRALIPTGIAIATTPDVYIRLAPRSGIALKNGIMVHAGVVDADYRSEVGVILLNTDPVRSFWVHHGMRVAQAILEKISLADPEVVDELPDTLREGGFGSTGTQ